MTVNRPKSGRRMESKPIAKSFSLKSVHGPVIIERLQPQHESLTQLEQRSYTFTKNHTSLNLEFISVQKMDNVLHSIQRRLYKQREQRVFAEFVKANYTSTGSEAKYMQIKSEKSLNQSFARANIASTKADTDSDTKNFAHPQNIILNENMSKELVKELKICIAALHASVNHGNKVKFKNDDKQYIHRGQDMSMACAISLQNKQKNMNLLSKGATICKPQQSKPFHSKKMGDRPVKQAFKSRSLVEKKASAHPKIGVVSERSAGSSKKDFDALSLWKTLSEMEKVENGVRKNLQMMNTDGNVNVKIKGIERNDNGIFKENKVHLGADGISSGDVGISAITSGNEAKSLVHHSPTFEAMDVTSYMPIRNHGFQSGHQYGSSFATKFLSTNSDIVDTIKEFSNTLTDELVAEVSNEILDLPETFLIELLETEFDQNNLKRVKRSNGISLQ